MRKTITLSKFRSNLKSELASIEESDAPIVITRNKGKGNIVVISEVPFSSMEETGYLLST